MVRVSEAAPRLSDFWNRMWSAPRLLAWLNRGLAPHIRIELRVRWPLILVPISFLNQIFAPHPVWVVILVSLVGFYAISLFWVRRQAPAVSIERERFGTILVAGDVLREEFEVRNDSHLPLLWAEFVDGSDLPNYAVGRVVACGAASFYRWRNEAECRQRGVFRLGPHRLNFGDPFGLFAVEVDYRQTDVVLIYPRVVKLPSFDLPHGNVSGIDRRRRPVLGSLPAASVSDYRPGDSLRHIHWPSTARRARLTVKDLEIEPSGDVWIVLDLNRNAQRGVGPLGTLEHGIVLAASLAAELLAAGEQRSVGLLTVSGSSQGSGTPGIAGAVIAGDDGATHREGSRTDSAKPTAALGGTAETIIVPPQPGQAQLWNILSALAPVQETDVPLADVLHSGRDTMGRRRTLVVVTPDTSVVSRHPTESPARPAMGMRIESQPADDWITQLIHLQSSGIDSTVLLVLPGDASEADTVATEKSLGTTEEGQDELLALRLREMLARHNTPTHVLRADSDLQPVLTFRRTRTVIRSTPSGGAVTYEVEEEVG